MRPACPIVRGRIAASFCLHFVGQTRKRREVEIVRQLQAFVAPKSGDIGGLAIQVDRIFRIDLELLGNFRIELAEPRPDARQIPRTDRRIGQKLEGRAPLAVLVEREPVAGRFGRGQRDGARQRRARP